MTDRELLENAAKAAGWTWWRSKHGYLNLKRPDGSDVSCCEGWSKFDTTTGEALPEPTFADALSECGWNPLHNDGDALRLAATLAIDVCYFPGFREVRAEAASVNAMGHAIEDYAEDMAAATRRAIVRVAAAMAPA